MLFKNSDFDADTSEQYLAVRLLMAAIYKVDTEKFGPETLSNFQGNFSSMGKDSRDKNHVLK